MKLGIYIFLALFFFSPLFTLAQTGTRCNQFGPGATPSAGYGAAWNPFDNEKELWVSATCTTVGAQVTYTVGTDNDNHYVYKTEYFYSESWQPFTSTGTFVPGSTEWFAMNAKYTHASPPAANYFWVGYVCRWQSAGAKWTCGCKDAACASPMWLLQGVQYPDSGTTGGTTAGTTGGTTGGSSGGTTAGGTTGVVGGTTAGGTTAACTHYMAPNGSDSAAGTINAPWKTFKAAGPKLVPGSVLCARGGTYAIQGSMWSSPSGTQSQPIVFKNYPGERPIFEGQDAQGQAIQLRNVQWIVIEGLQIQHFDDQYGNGALMMHDGAKNITVQNMTFIENGKDSGQDHHIYLTGGDQRYTTIRNSFFINPASGGIHQYQYPNAKHLYIYNNVFIGGTWGVILATATEDVHIYNNTFANSGGNIDLGCHGDNDVPIKDVFIRNNVSYSSTGDGLVACARDAPAIKEDYNLWYATDGKPIRWKGSQMSLDQFRSATGMGAHSIQADPKLVNPNGKSASDFRVQAGSPAINAGINNTNVAHDFDWKSRPVGVRDMGAFEQ